MTSVLILPGFENSGPAHWQSAWEREHGFVRVEQDDWFTPLVADWVRTLGAAIAAATGPVVLAAHSLGCVTVAHWAASGADTAKVAGALLVAPADIDTADVPPLYNFRPIPLARLPFPSIVVAGDDDPWAALPRSEQFAAAWGSRLVVVPGGGHLNADSNLGSWPEGLALLHALHP
ncbi:alpha/beta hydrolase [Catellatospora sp. TT07R-123]|uniref:RBBP9/YdeN family alpha/beta hydrolase n=1 Tax=Catellatospora sp. TT07R-123 TaxID=2733863 RepID=UPI001B1AFCE6|nr:alpha/beta hydrolase [Catellatospora sp. TT07R-123]GHJ43944.1 alpha/beta hydrolase [Catellatospora sp. TT07R-123]